MKLADNAKVAVSLVQPDTLRYVYSWGVDGPCIDCQGGDYEDVFPVKAVYQPSQTES